MGGDMFDESGEPIIPTASRHASIDELKKQAARGPARQRSPEPEPKTEELSTNDLLYGKMALTTDEEKKRFRGELRKEALNAIWKTGEKGVKLVPEIAQKLESTGGGLFGEIQDRLEDCTKQEHPDSGVEAALLAGRNVLVKVAEEAGVFKEASQVVKDAFNKRDLTLGALEHAIRGIDVGIINEHASDLTKVNRASIDLDEIAGAYVLGVNEHIALGRVKARLRYMRKKGAETGKRREGTPPYQAAEKEKAKFERRKDLLTWGRERGTVYEDLALDELVAQVAKQTELREKEEARQREATRAGDGGMIEAMKQALGQGIIMQELGRMSEEEQRQQIREILNTIEESELDWVSDQSISRLVVRLEASYGLMRESVRKETKARLSLHDSDKLMKRAKGWVKHPAGGFTINMAVETADNRGHMIDDRVMEFFLGTGSDYKEKVEKRRKAESVEFELRDGVAMAWDKLQEINLGDYEGILRRLGLDTSNAQNYTTDKVEARKQEVMDWIKRELGGGYSDAYMRKKRFNSGQIRTAMERNKAAAKYIQLAGNLADATLDSSRWNLGASVGNDQPAECFYIKEWRKMRADSSAGGRDHGARINIEAVPGIGDSWLGLSLEKVADETTVNLLGESRVVSIKRKPIYAEDIDPTKLVGSNALSAYASTTLSRYLGLQELFRNIDVKPGEITRSFLNRIVVFFGTADKAYSKDSFKAIDLRFWWLAGVADEGMEEESLGWDSDTLVILQEAVSIKTLSEGGKPFIPPAQWQAIERMTNMDRRATKLDRKRRKKRRRQKMVE